MTIKAAIFDLDGTVIANEEVYGVAFREILRTLNIHTKEKYPHTGGIGVEENWPKLIEKHKIKTKKTIQQLASETQNSYIRNISKIDLKGGFIEFINDLKDSDIKTALATSNEWWIVEKVFDQINIESYFDSVTTGEEVKFKKPSPDIFLLAAEKLGVDPEDCVVFEDSAAGVEAAHAAGMKVVAIARDDDHAKELKEADIIFKKKYPDLRDFIN